METNNQTSCPVDLGQLTEEQKAALRAQLNAEAKTSRIGKREAYEGLRAQFMQSAKENTIRLEADVRGFKEWLNGEANAFIKVMQEYGQTRRDAQQNYTITDGDFRMSIACNKVKSFDERADMAADRLMEYLKGYMAKSENGVNDPMYQMAMTLLERNQAGDLDYKSISKLYELEDKFEEEYADIMSLFKESNVVQKTATNYYFFLRNPDTGIWRRLEPSFCRIVVRQEGMPPAGDDAKTTEEGERKQE